MNDLGKVFAIAFAIISVMFLLDGHLWAPLFAAIFVCLAFMGEARSRTSRMIFKGIILISISLWFLTLLRQG